MTEAGVIPRPGDRQPPSPFVQTGDMFSGASQIVFGHEGETVVIVTSEDVTLGPEDQDLFAWLYFGAILAARASGQPVRRPPH